MEIKIKLCIIAGADSIHSYKWIKYFAEAGYKITWISLTPTTFDPIPGVSFFHIDGGAGIWGMLKAVLQTRRIVANSQPDLVHVHYVGANAILGLYSGVKTIVATPWGSDVILNKHVFFKRFFAARILRRADLISCDAWHMRNEVMQFGVSAERINIINFGIDSQRFSPRMASSEIRKQYDLGAAPAVISLRNFEPVYDIPTLLHAVPLVLKKHPLTRFMLVGRGSLDAELKALAQSLGIADAVRFVGFVPNVQLPDTLCSLDVYVSSSLSDAGIAASTAEAMACELPVVVTDSGENNRWIEDGKNGYLVPVKQPEAMAEKICLLLSNSALRSQLGAAGRHTIQERNDFNAEMAKMDLLYQGVVGKP
ncbi:GDP-mannose-dependent alpha-(1-6)-phosphatidylinositol monomannoside mannosyltransferase [Curvibacter sp. AEP1-3]|uniref:glycosyltransferase family 4 protein n=1 Tax=Curvibacter sp. AEP1-3 TaxID=1844971 RepID=UPI000B3CA61F|nr:glycosyltransferase family 4 protein [Curvibacter sp. AEP1-3]ARV20027.1 GDP-mannose-dependent alpha-(1-6)-phosphatidylinositol monomannoside mannosyltransferase [Curvibacter sp. AEP1-3]